MNPILLFRSCAGRSFVATLVTWPMMLAGVLLAVVTLGLSSCGTARGFGSDVERTGEKIEEAASR